MKILLNARQLACICLVIIAGMVASCKKDKTISGSSDKVELLSFGPVGVMHGDKITFVGNNLNKVTSIDLVGASIASTAFVSQTKENIVLVVPQSAQEGFVKLRMSATDSIVSITKLNFLVPVKIKTMPKTARPGDNITITGDYLNWVTGITFAKGTPAVTIVSQTLNQLVVTVPQNAQTGTLFFYTGGVKPLSIETDSVLNVTLPSITSFSPSPAVRLANLTITGNNLDLVKGILFKGITTPITTFVSKTATQLVVTIPAAANKGKITLVAYSDLNVESTASLLFVGDLPDLAPLGYAMYIDNLQNGWQNWGWGSTTDFVNTDNVRDGTASIKQVYTGQWSALKFANGSIATAPYTEITFSIFGMPGTAGKNIRVMANGGTAYVLPVQQGVWTEYKLTKAQLGNPTTINDLTFQNEDWTGGIYMDHVGLR